MTIEQNENFTVPDSLGFVKANVQLKIVDVKTGKSLGPNQIGEFVFKKPGMLLTYYNSPKATPIDNEGNNFIFMFSMAFQFTHQLQIFKF